MCNTCDLTFENKISASEHYDKIHKETKILQRQYNCEVCDSSFGKKWEVIKHFKKIHSVDKVKCDICEKEFQSKRILKVHIQDIHSGRVFPCDECGKKFFSMGTLKLHHDVKHNKNPTYDFCDSCDYKSVRKGKVKRHISQVHENKIYKCDTCKKEFKNPSYLKRHKFRFHTENATHISLKCEFCDFTTNRPKTKAPIILKRHQKTKHRRKRNRSKFHCESGKCDFISNVKHIYLEHRFAEHNEALNICNLCNYKTNRKQLLSFHMENAHKVDQKIKCKDCDKKYSDEKYLIRHVARQHNNGFYFCDLCDFKTKISKDILHHKRKVHVPRVEIMKFEYKVFKCKKCDFEAPGRVALASHINVEHKKDAKDVFTCDMCPYVHANKSAVLVHKSKMHKSHEEKKFQCEKCDKRYENRGRLQRHRRVVHEEIRYLCKYCGFQAKENRNLEVHLEKIHNVQKFETSQDFKCQVCPYVARSQNDFTLHIASSHTKQIFSCDQCQYENSTESLIKIHKQKVHSSVQERFKVDYEGLTYQCQFCDYQARAKEHLKDHIKITHVHLIF